MTDPTMHALLAWNRAESRRWHGWFLAHPSALDLPMGNNTSVRSAIRHIFAVDLRYAQRLAGQPVSAFETIDAHDVDGLFALAERAHALLAGWRGTASEADLAQSHTFMTISAGERTASAHKIVIHACTHHVRHWAQIATLVRMHGKKSYWPHDFLFCDAMA